MLKALYIIAIGLLFAAFVGFGINTFYQGPEYPQCPAVDRVVPSEDKPAIVDEAAEKECDNLRAAYNDTNEDYQRNLSVIYLLAAIIIIVVSLFGIGKIAVIGDGITLGGVILLFVGIVVSFGSGSEIWRFTTVTVGLAVVLFLAYWKFIRHNASGTT
jgi:hypothetical protein